MGGNGAREHYRNGTLGDYTGARFENIGEIDGVKVISVSTQSNTTVPMESFTSSMYYVASPKDSTRIEHITFYDKNGNIKVSIDMEYDKDGVIIPFQSVIRKGKTYTKGIHLHKWTANDDGDNGRKSHAANNIFSVNSYYMRFVNKAIKYNNEHKK